MSYKAVVVDIDQVPLEPVTREGARDTSVRVVLSAAQGAPSFTLRLFLVQPQGHTPRHHHPFEHQVIVQQGSGTLWTARGEHALVPGVAALIPPDLEHQFLAGPEGLQFFCIVPHAGHQP